MIALMEHISEREWCAGWLSDLEHILWVEVQHPADRRHLSEEEAAELRWLSEQAGGWIRWNDATHEAQWVPMAEWLELYDERVAV